MPATFDFECQNLNIIPIEKCNELYNRCKVGVCMSASNPSRIPFEMMAAGLPVVEMYKENNIYDMPDGGVLLARTTPEAIASAIIYLVDHRRRKEEDVRVWYKLYERLSFRKRIQTVLESSRRYVKYTI